MRALLLAVAFAPALLAVETQALTFAGVRFTVCTVDVAKEKLELLLNDDDGKPLNTFARTEAWLAGKNRALIFATNAGMYHKDYSPVGLFVAGAKQLAPLNLRNDEGNFFLKPNAVFALTDRGAFVVESSRFPALPGKVDIATQSGPALVLGGVIHPKFTPGSKNKLHRNGVGVATPQRVVFAISDDPVNFHDFAVLFRDKLGCKDALFFDGTVSSLHLAAQKRSDFRINLGPILGITAQKP